VLRPEAPDLVTLDLLASVAELGSLGRAAERHHVSQPAVSMRMTGLERRLGVALLQRDPTGTRLTLAGVRVVEAGRRVLGEMDGFLAAVEALRAEERSLLRVASSLTVAEHLLPAWLGTIYRDVPDVSLTLEVTNSARVIATVAAETVDIGFTEGPDHHHPDLDSAVIRGDHLVVVVSPDHPWAARADPLGGTDLAGTELVAREEGSGTREVLDEVLRPWGGVRTRRVLGSLAAVTGAARRGEGPAVLSALAVAGEVTAGRLVVVPTEGLDFSRSLRAVWRSDRPLTPLAQRLLDAAAGADG
jgi:DNA-binding transcriptional LysR family regulator